MERELAYIAGLLDGEGALFIGKYPRKGNARLGYQGYMAIINKHVPMLQHIKSIIGGKIVVQGKLRKCYTLSLSANEIRQWLPRLQPYLIVKKEQAEVLLAFLERQAKNASAPISDGLAVFYDVCYRKMKGLHHFEFDYKEPKKSLGIRKCETCQTEFEAFSSHPKKKYCSGDCKKKMHWTRSNRRIAHGLPAWGGLLSIKEN